MQVSHELAEELTGVISIKLDTEDYKDQVEKVLRDYRKRADMPGFRKGHVPFGMVKKMFGKSVMAEEVNRILLDQLQGYIREQDLQLLGQPLPQPDDSLDFDPHKYGDLEFHYDIGLAPQLDGTLSDKEKFTTYAVKIDEALLNKYTSDLQRRYGKVSQLEVAEENDLLQGEFVELDETGQEKEGGIRHTSTITLEFLEDDKTRKALTGSKVGDVHEVNPDKVSKGEADKAQMLGISPAEAETLKSTFRFTVSNIYHMDAAELNQELFDKVFGQGTIEDKAGFDAKLTEELERVFSRDSEQLLYRHIQEGLIEKFNPSLPDEFLKKWLQETSEEPVEPAQVEEDYETYSKQLRWQLIENKLIRDHQLQVTHEEALTHTKNLVLKQYQQYGIPEVEDSVLEEQAQAFLAKEEEGKRIFENLYRDKLFDLFRNTFKLKTKEVDFDEFVKLATGKPPKKGIFSNLKSLFES
ncbi:MAG: trigger factor [Leptolyngbya sp. SIO3F4]|nr:trigger factor [Leptolyngbya sp. SIO3F4]